MPSSLQPSFLRFHESVKLGNTDENATLRSKRDLILERMRGKKLTFDWFNQGSYAMGTGVVPVKSDYDIDVGIVFTGSTRPADPLAVKQWVYDAVLGHTANVEWRRHCIRVQYVKAGEPTYHVDLAVYWKDAYGSLSLACGKQHSGADSKAWQDADPKGLVNAVTSHLADENRWQFRRAIRYLKRWKNLQFPVEGNASPPGVAITIAALRWFSPKKADWNATTATGYDDLGATLDLVNAIRSGFRQVWRNGEYATAIELTMPVKPHKDVCVRMTNQQMKESARSTPPARSAPSPRSRTRPASRSARTGRCGSPTGTTT
jgi:hypothetical protein